MYTTEILKLTNNGNATAHFKWKLPEECNFTIDPLEGSVEGKKQTLSVEITYKPEGRVRQGGDITDLKLEVIDGDP